MKPGSIALALGLLCLSMSPAGAADQASDQVSEQKESRTTAKKPAPSGVIQLDETVISGNQELPKVLYIVPWQQPDGLPDIELEPEFTELEVFRRLYPPAYRRELKYYELLNAASKAETEE